MSKAAKKAQLGVRETKGELFLSYGPLAGTNCPQKDFNWEQDGDMYIGHFTATATNGDDQEYYHYSKRVPEDTANKLTKQTSTVETVDTKCYVKFTLKKDKSLGNVKNYFQN